MNYVIMDLEWNQPMSAKSTVKSPAPLRGEIIQIGAIKLNEHCEAVDCYKQMVSPRYYTRMHFSVAKLTHIRTADLKRGIPFPEAFKSFLEWCGEDFVFLTWGPDDIPMLHSNMLLHGISPEELPPSYNAQILFAKQIAGENRQFSLSAAVEMVNETPPVAAHDALNDAVSTAKICRHLDLIGGLEDYGNGRFSSPIVETEDSPLYARRSDALSSPDIRTFPDPETGDILHCGKWISQKNGRYMAIAKRDDTVSYLVRVRFRKVSDGRFRAGRSIYPLNEDLLATFRHHQQRQQQRQRQHHRRRRQSASQTQVKETEVE